MLAQIFTKAGTNGLHGSLFEYHTDNQLTARNVFQNVANPITGKVLPVFRRNEIGAHTFKAGFDMFRDQDNAPFTGPTLRPSF